MTALVFFCIWKLSALYAMLKAMPFYSTWSERQRVWSVTGLVALVLYSVFSWGLPQRYNSPDEAANAYFAHRVAAGKSLAAPAPYVALTSEPVVHPRSTTVVRGHLIPVSFLGFPLFLGFLGRLLGAWVLPYVSVLGAAMGLTALYFILRDLTNRTAATITTALVAVLPAYWYYHARSFFHNGLFFDLLLVSVWAGFKSLRTKNWRYYLLTGFAGGIAIAVRSSEVFWLAATAALWLVLSRKNLVPRYLWLMLAGAVVGFWPVFTTNYAIYGRFLSVGYRSGLVFPSANLAAAGSLLGELILPFGFNLSVIGQTVAAYLWQVMWWWALLAALGLAATLSAWQRWTAEQRRAGAAALLTCLWLVLLYGSWKFNDNPDPAAVTLGTAYIRYWLPLYAFLLVPSGVTLAWVWHHARLGRAITLGVVAGFFILSAATVVFDPQEGLLQVRRNVQKFNTIAREVRGYTEVGSVVVTDGITDKFFWPERQVIVSEEPVERLTDIRQLLQAGVPVYRFHPTWAPADIDYLNNRRLKADSLTIAPVAGGFDGYSLYKFTRTP